MMLKNQKGFTVIELILAITLFLIVLGLGYQLLFYTQTSFARSEHQWQRQAQVIALSEYIADVVDKAIYVEITSDSTKIQDDDAAIYKEENGEDIYFKNGLIETKIIGSNLDILFSKTTDVNGDFYADLMQISIIASDISYSLDTKVKIENMLDGRRIEGDSSGDILIFRTEETVGAVPITIDSCYIATAANGSKMKPSVRLLRRFRDQFLLKTNLGNVFVDFYYKTSPPIAHTIAQNETLKLITRIILLPLVGAAVVILDPILIICIIGGILMALLAFNTRKKKKGYLYIV